MRFQLTVVCSLVASLAIADQTASAVSEKEREAKREAFMMRTGGRIPRPDSQKGLIAVIDTQKRVNATNITAIVSRIVADTKMNVRYFSKPAGDPASLLKECKADLAIVVLDDVAAPSALVAPEDRWATVNVAKLGMGLKTPEAQARFVDSRTRKEILRVYSLLCGGGSSQFKGSLFNCATLNEADACDEALPIDLIGYHAQYLKSIGVQPLVTAAYSQACREGWAPEPTNKYQKATWDRIHALPTKPIRIVPESQRKAK